MKKIKAKHAGADGTTGAGQPPPAEVDGGNGRRAQPPEELEGAPPTNAEETPAAVEDHVDAQTTGAVDPIAELQGKVDRLEEGLLRAKADYQNLVRRSAAERNEAVRYANANLMRSLLVVLDDFERSLAAAESSDNLSAVVEGVRLVYDNLCKALRDHGLEPIEATHRPFDPSVHEAMLQQPSADHPTGTVIEQIARGYRLGERVVRPAKVIVSKTPDEACGSSSDADEATGAESDTES